jgi:hypothetical protein
MMTAILAAAAAVTTDTTTFQQPRIYPSGRYVRAQKQRGQQAGQTITVSKRMGPLTNQPANRTRLGDAQSSGSRRAR